MRRLALALVLLASSGCVTLPDSGPVTTAPRVEADQPAGTFDYNPERPEPGDAPATIVSGFLDSLRETPLTYGPAREYLTAQAGSTWAPSQRTIVYDDGTLTTTVAGETAQVRLGSAIELDARGSWLGDLGGGRGLAFDLSLVQEDGEWRIADPPDALIVSRTHFETRFVRYDLHYFDPSGRVLVPEPVYLPLGDTTASLLVSGLLAGPRPALLAVERTYFPPGTRLELSVPPIEQRLVDVSLSPEILEADRGQLDLAMAQLAWTLRQLPGVDRMRVTVDGAPVDRTTGASARSLDGWSAYDPAVGQTGDVLYGMSGTELFADAGDDLESLGNPFGRVPIRSLGVSFGDSAGLRSGTRLAGVSTDGTSVLEALVADSGPAVVRYTGTDVLRPLYDRFDQLWVLDRSQQGARLLVGAPNGRLRAMRVEGLTGRNVSAVELSRDGTRLAAIVDGRLTVSRVNRTEVGRPTVVGAATPVPFAGGTARVRPVDLGWVAPSLIGVLARIGPATSQVFLASADGSDVLPRGTSTIEPLFERAAGLVTWPGAGARLLVRTVGGDLYELSNAGRWAVAELSGGLPGESPGLSALTFPG